MKFGFNFLLWTTRVGEQHFPLFDKLKAAGYDGVEIPIAAGSVADFEAIGARIRDAGLLCTASGSLPTGHNPISPDKAERQKGLDHLNWTADRARALGAEVYCGPFYQPLGEFSGQGPTADEKARCVDIHKQAAQYAAGLGLDISIEPLNRFECYFLNTADDAAELVRRVDEPNYGYLYDTFHFNIEENSLTGAIERTGRHINHVHICENNRGTPGAGHIDFAAVFKALRVTGYDRWMTVEAFGSTLPDLSAATKIWRPLFPSEEAVYTGAIKLMRDGWAAAAG